MAIAPIEIMGTNNTSEPTSSRDAINKNEFLLLLVTQLQHQDPLNPMDNAEFTSQTAQFASLEQLQNINENLVNLQNYGSALFDENAVSFIGKTVKASDNSINYTNGSSAEMKFDLERDAKEVYVYIYDSSGNLVKEIVESGTLAAGEHSLTWNGTDNDNTILPDGKYSFEVQADDVDGITFEGAPFYTGKITAVHFGNGIAYLSAEDREIAMGNVKKVSGE